MCEGMGAGMKMEQKRMLSWYKPASSDPPVFVRAVDACHRKFPGEHLHPTSVSSSAGCVCANVM